MKRLARCILITLTIFPVFRVDAGKPLTLNSFEKSVVPFIGIQAWNTLSNDNRIDGEAVDNRYAVYFRRARIGLKGRPVERLYYNIHLSADCLGKDQYLSSRGSSNSGTIKIWSAYATYRLSASSEWLNLTTGYMLPHMSRESTTSPWAMSSLDKSETSCYLRRFATGKNNGISSGLNFGGTGSLGQKLSACYNVAVISNMNGGTTQGKEYAPLFLGHAFITFGAPERKSYKYTTADNVLNNNSFVSVGVGGSYQDECDFFEKNTTISTDLKVNLKGFHFVGEYNKMKRKSTVTYEASAFLIRSGYNIDWNHTGILEPTVCYRTFSGDDNGKEAIFFTGEDNQWDIGLNWWLNTKKIKLNVHYLINSGDGNNISMKESDDSIRGDIAVVGLQVVL
jgi:hypothetical protein